MGSSASEAPSLSARKQRRRVLRSFGYAFQGLGTIARTQPNFRIHLVAALAALGLGFLLRLSPPEIALIVVSVALVLSLESINTAVETVCDLVSPGPHPLVKRAKDVSAAAVLIAAMSAVAIAGLLFVPRLLGLLSR